VSKETLKAIVDSDYSVPSGGDLAALTQELMQLLGSPDSDLREGSLEILWHWGEVGKYNDAELRDIGDRMSENLAVGLGKFGTDTVFLRSFSALILEMVVLADEYRDAGLVDGKSPFLTREVVLRWCTLAVAAFAGEKDFRGCTARNGWAHSLAHMSDLLGALARSPHLERAYLEQILTAVADKLIAPTDTVLLFEEEHRMIRGAVMHALLRNEIQFDFLHAWIDKLAHRPDGATWGSVFGADTCDQDANRARVNVRSFLRALYFVLTWGMTSAPYPSQAGNAFSAYYDRPIAAREVLLADVAAALKSMNRPMYRSEAAT
jgi:hypothetical protein